LQTLGERCDEDHMLTKRANMPFFSLHTLAAARGDGLHPEFVKLFTRLAAGADATLSESAQPPAGFAFLSPVVERFIECAREVTKSSADEPRSRKSGST
jgi:hypothetical protein